MRDASTLRICCRKPGSIGTFYLAEVSREVNGMATWIDGDRAHGTIGVRVERQGPSFLVEGCDRRPTLPVHPDEAAADVHGRTVRCDRDRGDPRLAVVRCRRQPWSPGQDRVRAGVDCRDPVPPTAAEAREHPADIERRAEPSQRVDLPVRDQPPLRIECAVRPQMHDAAHGYASDAVDLATQEPAPATVGDGDGHSSRDRLAGRDHAARCTDVDPRAGQRAEQAEVAPDVDTARCRGDGRDRAVGNPDRGRLTSTGQCAVGGRGQHETDRQRQSEPDEAAVSHRRPAPCPAPLTSG